LWEPVKLNFKFHRNCVNTGKIGKFLCVTFHFVKFEICFLGFPWEVVFGVITDGKLHPWLSEKVGKNAVCLELFWCRVFVL